MVMLKLVSPKVTYFRVVAGKSDEVESCAMILLYNCRISHIKLNSSRVISLQMSTGLEVDTYFSALLFQSIGDACSFC